MEIEFIVPEYVQTVARILYKEGYQAYIAGGAVRDLLLGKPPKDFDLATDCKPETMLKIFPKSVSTGARFGMVTALVRDEQGENMEVEVTTFRSEEQYIDGRWPSKVEFIDEIDKDLGRRDFTINAMAIDLSQNPLDGTKEPQKWEIYDPFDGARDIGIKMIRAVGTPIERFKEDGLRAFRACRFASQLEFDIEDDTMDAIKRAVPVAAQVSMERIRDEFIKTLYNSPKPSRGIEIMRKTGLLELFMPELLESYGAEQKVGHVDDVYWHALKTCDVAIDRVKLAALLHDIAKPRKDMGDGRFYGHDIEGEKMTREIMKRMKFSNAEIEHTARLVRNHMFYFPHEMDNMSQEEIDRIEQRKWTDGAVRRFIARIGEENIEDLFELRIADAGSNPSTSFDPTEIAKLQHRISEVREKDMALKVTDLKITGEDIIALGVEKGPRVGQILAELLELVMDDPMLNTKEELEGIVKKML